MCGLGIIGRGRDPGSNGPDRLVSEDEGAYLVPRKPLQCRSNLPLDHLKGVSGLSLAHRLPHADHGLEFRREGCPGLGGDHRVQLPELVPALGMADQGRRATEIRDHRGARLTRMGAVQVR